LNRIQGQCKLQQFWHATENIEDWRNIMARYRLMPSDASIVSTCIFNGIKKIATFDNDFK